jgi:hypothetical protein
MGRFLPPAPFREECGCVRSESESSGSIVTLGRKFKTEQPIESQYCEDNIIEQSVGTQGLIVGVFDGHGGHLCSRVASVQLVASVKQLMDSESGLNPEAIRASSTIVFHYSSVLNRYVPGTVLWRCGTAFSLARCRLFGISPRDLLQWNTRVHRTIHPACRICFYQCG